MYMTTIFKDCPDINDKEAFFTALYNSVIEICKDENITDADLIQEVLQFFFEDMSFLQNFFNENIANRSIPKEAFRACVNNIIKQKIPYQNKFGQLPEETAAAPQQTLLPSEQTLYENATQFIADNIFNPLLEHIKADKTAYRFLLMTFLSLQNSAFIKAVKAPSKTLSGEALKSLKKRKLAPQNKHEIMENLVMKSPFWNTVNKSVNEDKRALYQKLYNAKREKNTTRLKHILINSINDFFTENAPALRLQYEKLFPKEHNFKDIINGLRLTLKEDIAKCRYTKKLANLNKTPFAADNIKQARTLNTVYACKGRTEAVLKLVFETLKWNKTAADNNEIRQHIVSCKKCKSFYDSLLKSLQYRQDRIINIYKYSQVQHTPLKKNPLPTEAKIISFYKKQFDKNPCGENFNFYLLALLKYNKKEQAEKLIKQNPLLAQNRLSSNFVTGITLNTAANPGKQRAKK